MSHQKNHVILIRPSPMPLGKGTPSFPPFGCLYLAAMLLEKDYRVTLIDTSNEEAEARLAHLLNKEVLCIGISTMTGMQLANAVYLARIVRRLHPDLPLIWGGVHPTILPDETLRDPLVDYIVWGEGESSFPALLQRLADHGQGLEEVPGIGYRLDDRMVVNPDAGFTSLNRIFDLPYHLLDMRTYARPRLIGAKHSYSILTSRGCPFRCAFCINSSAAWENTTMRFHTVEHVVADVKKMVREYGADLISLADENVVVNEKRLLDLFEALNRAGLNVKYRFSGRVDMLLRLSPACWKELKRLGVVAVGAGLESGSQNLLHAMNKRITLEQIRKLDALLTEHRLHKSYNFLTCTPSETQADREQTLKLVLDLAVTSDYTPYPFIINRYTPQPGTKMFAEAKQAGLVEPSGLEGWKEFDIGDFFETVERVRPWLKHADLPAVRVFFGQVENLNALFTGLTADKAAITAKIAAIRKLYRISTSRDKSESRRDAETQN